jgi:F0F1-type ATP synthase membrane subunit c/vacuolar-type H+-ATPase subunit K
MDSARKQVRMIGLFVAASIVLYLGLTLRLPSTATPNQAVYVTIAFLAVSVIVTALLLRQKMIVRAEMALSRQPDDGRLLNRWRQGYIVTFALYEAVALYGLVLHFLGHSLAQVLPFFAVGFGLMLSLRPKAAAAPEFPPSSRDTR